MLGEGGLTSLLVHAGIVVVVVLVSQGDSKGKDKDKIDFSEVTFKDALPPPPEPPPPPPVQPDLPPPPPPPPPPPAAAPTPTVVETPKKPKKPRPAAKPDTAVVAPPTDNPPPPEPVAGGQPGGVEGGVEGGVVGGKIGGVEGGTLGGTGDGPPQPTNAVLPFGAGMERPRKLSGRDPEYTREALEAKVEGTMIVRCVIELDGKLEDCKVIKSLPYMEQAVLSALATHTYSPVMFQGRPTRVNYVFNIKLVAQQK
ncbi:MAG: energy transducer TonB [Deltaproteobacteria bacterium]|nr:energy transducer TonB [Deltaproteobacteria bacterium]